MVTPRSPLDDLAEQVAGPGTRVRDPRAFTKFLLEGADSYEIASLEEQALAKGVDLSPVRAWASNPQEVIQGYKQRLAAITPEVQASQAERGQAFTRRGINPFGVDPFGQQSILSNTGVQLGMAAATPYRFAAGEVGAAIGSEGAKAAGLGPNWQVAGGLIGGVAGGAPEVPVALTKGVVRGGAAVGRAGERYAEAIGKSNVGNVLSPPAPQPRTAGMAVPDVQPPSLPPTGQPPQSAVDKLIRVIKAERPARGPTERMRSIERAKRAGAGAEALKQGSDPEAAFRSALGQQRGELPTAVSHGIPDTDFTPADVSELLDTIRGHGRIRFYEKLSTRTALYKAINYAAGETDQLPAPHEFELLEEVFGRDLASALQSRKGNLGRLALEVMGIPKTLRSSIDLSAPMRQGVFLSGRHPKEWLQAWGPMFKSLKSDRAALESYDRILADPDYQEIVGSVIPSRQRLSIVNPTGDALNMGARSANEEVFISRLANKIPGIRASNRAYTTYLNELRYNVAKTTLNNWKKAGVDVTPEKMDMLGRFINISTGRGRLGKLEQISPALSATFWSPRLLSSRFETPTLALQALKAGDKEIARLAAEELAAFVGMGVTALTLISLSGIGRVELDPRSSDFGKIRIGGTSLDFWGGFQQMARYTAQFMTSERKPLTKNGVLVDPAKAGMEPVQRSEVAFNFLRSKLAPGVPSLLGNEMTNRTFTGDPYSKKVNGKTVQTTRPALGFNDALEINTRLDEAVQQMTPLFLLELTRAIENDGWEGGLRTAPGITGVGVQSIPTTDARQSGNKQSTFPTPVFK